MKVFWYASLAQLFRALPCQGRGRELESLSSHHNIYDKYVMPFWAYFCLSSKSNLATLWLLDEIDLQIGLEYGDATYGEAVVTVVVVGWVDIGAIEVQVVRVLTITRVDST